MILNISVKLREVLVCKSLGWCSLRHFNTRSI